LGNPCCGSQRGFTPRDPVENEDVAHASFGEVCRAWSGRTILTCNAQQTQATIEGHATINGSGSYTFQIIVQDNGSSGSSDAYGIRLTNGYNSGVQPLRSGNVDIHKT